MADPGSRKRSRIFTALVIIYVIVGALILIVPAVFFLVFAGSAFMY